MTFKSKFPDVKPDECKYGQLVSNFFWHQLDRFSSKTLFVDYESKRTWRGDKIKEASELIAQNLIEHYGLRKHTNCVLFYKHNDYIQVTALGIIFAGSSVCVGYDLDPEREHEHMLKSLMPEFVFVRHELVPEMLRHCNRIANFKPRAIVNMDDDAISKDTFKSLTSSANTTTLIIGLHTHLLERGRGSQVRLAGPVQVDPDWPAFILLTSGSTGRPKPAGRSQRNSLYVTHSLNGASELWDLNESSVVAGHLALDHGTGIFQLKQNLARGYTSILMDGYDLERMLAAIKQYRISDIVLGSALLHNFLNSSQVAHLLECGDARSHFGSLRNFIAVGSSIASQALAREFMARVPGCSVRQAFGMTECGFLCIVPRELSLTAHDLDSRIVGFAMPNVELKLMALDDQHEAPENTTNESNAPRAAAREITEPNMTGELYVRGPTVSPGYHGAEFKEQSRVQFLPDGFYRSGDVCSFTPERMLRIHGRKSEMLCLYDGWKVLPVEIEQVLLEHPLLCEAAIIGVPHPQLPTCHAPRAYVVAREGVKVIKEGEEEEEEAEVQVQDDNDEQSFQAKATAAVKTRPASKAKSNGHSNGHTNGHSTPVSSSNNNNNNSSSNHHHHHHHHHHHQPGREVNGQVADQLTDDKKASSSRSVSKKQIFDFIAGRLSQPKHLVGGIVFMRELPKISTLGKVDKKSLRKMDGLI